MINSQPPPTWTPPNPTWTKPATGGLLTAMRPKKLPLVSLELRHQRGIAKTRNKYATAKPCSQNI
jgi:hypothetical protein